MFLSGIIDTQKCGIDQNVPEVCSYVHGMNKVKRQPQRSRCHAVANSIVLDALSSLFYVE